MYEYLDFKLIFILQIQGLPCWPDNMMVSTRYTLDDLKECYVNLKSAFLKARDYSTHAIREKYKSSK